MGLKPYRHRQSRIIWQAREIRIQPDGDLLQLFAPYVRHRDLLSGITNRDQNKGSFVGGAVEDFLVRTASRYVYGYKVRKNRGPVSVARQKELSDNHTGRDWEA